MVIPDDDDDDDDGDGDGDGDNDGGGGDEGDEGNMFGSWCTSLASYLLMFTVHVQTYVYIFWVKWYKHAQGSYPKESRLVDQH